MITRKYFNNISYLANTSARAILGNECHHVYSVAKLDLFRVTPRSFLRLLPKTSSCIMQKVTCEVTLFKIANHTLAFTLETLKLLIVG